MVLFDHLHSSYLPPTSTSSNLQRLLKIAIIKTNNDDDHPDNGNISFAIIRTYSKGQSSFIEWYHLKVYTLLKNVCSILPFVILAYILMFPEDIFEGIVLVEI